ncbi:MAG TPA: DUF3320 domain-containing protein [Phycisphaerae bacterium]|mgnify:CR=1 FL=1|nr:DUF3320 domain-containing protein [Phycisphaerae bacterium]
MSTIARQSPTPLIVDVDLDCRVNYAMQQNDIAVLKQLRISNPSEVLSKDLKVRISSEPEFFPPHELNISEIAPAGTWVKGPVDVRPSAKFLMDITERIRGSMLIEVVADSQTIARKSESIEFLAFDEWSGLGGSIPELLAAFVLPNDPVVESILRDAAEWLEQHTGSSSLSGYQTRSPKRVGQIAQGIYQAILARGIAYCSPPASFEENGQKIRLPDRIMTSKLGTCLDLALLMAACLEQSGLNPILMIVDGHAFVGVWLVEECFSDSASDDLLRVRKRIDLNEILVIESTVVTSATPNDFDAAVAAARRHLINEEEFRAVVDIKRCRKSRIRPLPSRRGEGEIDGEDPSSDRPTGDVRVFDIPSSDEVVDGKAAETPASRLDRWKRKLLDLSLHNRLINFKTNTKKTVPVLCPDIGGLEDALADGLEFRVNPRPSEFSEDDDRSAELHRARTGSDAFNELLQAELAARRLYVDLDAIELSRRLTEIFRSARTAKEEGGASALYLAAGFLKWYETTASEIPRLAPIILIPLEVQRHSVQEGFRISQGDEEPRVNITLLELLKKDHGLKLEGLDPIPHDDHGVDVQRILTIFRQAIKDTPRWDVIESTYIGFFSFTKFLMWRDLEERSKELEKNKVVRHLIHTSSEKFDSDGEFPDLDELDTKYPPSSVYCPMPADSSQLRAVMAGAEGKSFVLFGPPGTGKSQTITNLIAHTLGEGKSVLFVSEKMAALSVVRGRLERCGLGPFCMELHSNKSRKRDVIDQLGEAIDFRAAMPSDAWKSEADRLRRLRLNLNEYVSALHRVGSFGESVFQATSKLVGLKEQKRIDLKFAEISNISKEWLDGWRELIQRMQTAGDACGHVAGNTWTGSETSSWSLPYQAEVESDLDRLMALCDQVQQLSTKLGPMFALGSEWAWNQLSFVDKFLNFFVNPPKAPSPLLLDPDWPELSAYVSGVIKKGRERDSQKAELLSEYEEAILSLDLDSLIQQHNKATVSWFVPRFFGLRSVRRALSSVARADRKVAKDRVLKDLSAARSLREVCMWLKDADDRCSALLGSHWNGGEADWESIDQAVNWSTGFRELAMKAAGSKQENADSFRKHWAKVLIEHHDSLQVGGQLRDMIDRFSTGFASLRAARAELQARLGVTDDAKFWRADDRRLRVGMMKERLSELKSNLRGLRAWCNWQLVRSEASKAGLGGLISAYESAEVSTEQLRRSFDRTFYEQWVLWATQQDESLSRFFSPEHERKIREFRLTDSQYMKLTQQELISRIGAKKPPSTPEASDKSEAGILNRQRRLRRGHMPVRGLFQKIPNLLSRLKPCLLMSPISVAQYLDASHPPFDLVVFDEASQIPVWDAVGAIARGTEVVIVGDPKQLPPTNFFQRADETEFNDDDVVEDMESILDECLSANLPDLALRWHYRSRHESLITFSNYHYYGNDLLTFPSPYVGQGVSFRHIADGVYDKGQSRTNRAEAEAVVKDVLSRLMDPERSRLSIGIVTFSMAQQTLVEDLLDAAVRENPGIETYFSDDVAEPVFIKNLENVQGDERDVILFSVCYGPDQAGKVSMNFGPLNRDGGERRLNVAITRARQEVVVFSSLRPEKIDLSRTRSRGVQDLKCFLDYAERGPVAISQAITMGGGSDFESPFEREVCNRIRELGYHVDTQVGCSGYRIDLGVRDPENAGRYVLGIECDGANYHSAKTARDRDRLREDVLTDLGWTLHRVWSSDWWTDPDQCMTQIESAIQAAIDSGTHVERPDEMANVSSPEETEFDSTELPGVLAGEKGVDLDGGIDALPVYSAFRARGATRPAAEFYESSSNRMITQLLQEIVEHEGPVHIDVATRRAISCWGMTRVGSAIRNRIESLVPLAPVLVVEHDGGVFLWPKSSDPSGYDQFRIQGNKSDDQRDIDQIAPEEISAAIAYVLRRQISLPQDALIKEVAAILGFQRVGQSIRSSLGAGLQFAATRNDIDVQDGHVRYCG